MFVNGKYMHQRERGRGTTRTARVDQRPRRQREGSLAVRSPLSTDMLSAFVPQPQGLARFELRSGAAIPGRVDLARPRRTHAERRKAGRKFPEHRRSDARRNARDRSVEPPLRRRRRAVHDRHRGHQARFRPAGKHADHVHPLARPSWSPIATWIRCRSGASSPTPSAIRIPAIHRPRCSRACSNPSSIASPTSSNAWPPISMAPRSKSSARRAANAA